MADQEDKEKQQTIRPERSQSFKKERRDSGPGQSNRSSQGPKGKSSPSHLKQGQQSQQPEGHRGTTSGGGSSNNKQQGQGNNQKKYAVKKRPPPKEVPQRPNDVYIGERSNFNAQLAKCHKLFEGQHSEVYLHGLGPAIPRAVNVALELKKFYQGTVDYTVNTSTVKLIDDLIPLNDTTPPSQQFRKVSCVDIRVYRTVKIP